MATFPGLFDQARFDQSYFDDEIIALWPDDSDVVFFDGYRSTVTTTEDEW